MGTDRKRVTMIVPASIGDALKEWSATEGLTRADAVFMAWTEHQEPVAAEFKLTEEDEMRMEFGLAPLAVARRRAPVQAASGQYQFTIELSEKAVKHLNDGAASIGMSRQRYVAELLSRFFNS